MKLTVKHETRNLFGSMQEFEEVKNVADADDIDKAFKVLGRDHNAVVQAELGERTHIYYFDSVEDYNFDRLTEAFYFRNEKDTEIMPRLKAKELLKGMAG